MNIRSNLREKLPHQNTIIVQIPERILGTEFLFAVRYPVQNN